MPEIQIRLPDVGEGITQAEIVQWHVAVGDAIAEDQPFVDVMTDKATVELPSPVAGVVARLAADVGDFVAVGAPLLWITADAESGAPAGPDVPATPPTEPDPGTPHPAQDSPPPARPQAAPAVRRRARDLGIDLTDVTGTGPGGRILHADLDARITSDGPHSGGSPGASKSQGADVPDDADDDVTEVPLRGLRRHIARRMQEAHRIPHFSYIEEVDVAALQRLRATLNERADEQRPRLSVLPFIMRAVTLALAQFPALNARYDAEHELLHQHRRVHLGIATQTPSGLMVPVVRDADRRGLFENAAEVRRLADAAVTGRIGIAELSGSTITITSLGALGGLVSTPIINAPEVAIVGVNRIVERPVVADGVVRVGSGMNLSSSFDHRVIDGADAAGFIGLVKRLLEEPSLLWMDAAQEAP